MVKNRYFHLVTLAAAKETVRNLAPHKRTIRVPVADAAGRITGKPIFAAFSVPELHLSAMDGIAVHSQETHGASEQKPVTLYDAVRVNTGNLVPGGFDAVIMIEDVVISGTSYTIRSAAAPWQHIRPVGEDIGESEMILPAGHRIRPFEIGALVAYGIAEVEVLDLTVGLLPTGSELVPAGVRPAPGQVPESNMYMAASYLRSLGATPHHYPIVPDEPEQIRAAIEQGIRENDLLVISAGSSKGTRDYTAILIEELGTVHIHGVGIKPAKPVIIGEIEDTPVIGMPGYPLAAYTILRELVTDLCDAYGLSPPLPETIETEITTTLDSAVGTDEFVLLSAGKVGEKWVTVPQSRGAGVQMSLVRANAYLQIPSGKEGVMAGETIEGTLLVPRRDAESALLITGSHDPAVDHLGNLLGPQGVSVYPTHTGSMGGILALKKGVCHAAPMHLLDETGDYNRTYLQRYLKGKEIVLCCVAEREQGVISRDGLGFDDIFSHSFVNRQKGSGTRILLEYLLKERNKTGADISGYEREFTTHFGVGLAVKTGDADCGLGVFSVAKALGLSFVPVGTERYELAIDAAMLEEDERLQSLLATIQSDVFKDILTAMGGYRTEETGVLRRVQT